MPTQSPTEIVRRLGQVMPAQADPELTALYDDIRDALGVPFVNSLFRVLANRPDVLAHVWQRLAPGVRATAFAHAADALRTLALSNIPAAAPGVALTDLPGGELARRFTAAIHHVLPKLLLIATALRSGRLEPIHPAPAGGPRPQRDPTFARMALVDPQTASGELATWTPNARAEPWSHAHETSTASRCAGSSTAQAFPSCSCTASRPRRCSGATSRPTCATHAC